jgi:hypothetical protein
VKLPVGVVPCRYCGSPIDEGKPCPLCVPSKPPTEHPLDERGEKVMFAVRVLLAAAKGRKRAERMSERDVTEWSVPAPGDAS